jgi:hypothetical protein
LAAGWTNNNVEQVLRNHEGILRDCSTVDFVICSRYIPSDFQHRFARRFSLRERLGSGCKSRAAAQL